MVLSFLVIDCSLQFAIDYFSALFRLGEDIEGYILSFIDL